MTTFKNNNMGVEQLIKNIVDNNLQEGLFYNEFYDLDYDDNEFKTRESFLESLGIKNYQEVDSRMDTSEFWTVIHFIDEDIYLKLEGEYDSYGQGEHKYYDNIKQVFPKEVLTTIYE